MKWQYDVSDPWEHSSVTFDAIDAGIPPSRAIPVVPPFKSHSDRDNLINHHARSA